MNRGNCVLLHASLIFPKFPVISISKGEIKKLQYVLLQGMKVQKIEFRNIESTVLASLTGGCAGLTSVDLAGCRNITDAGLASLAGGCRGLTSVDLSGCVNITDAGVAILEEMGCEVRGFHA